MTDAQPEPFDRAYFDWGLDTPTETLEPTKINGYRGIRHPQPRDPRKALEARKRPLGPASV